MTDDRAPAEYTPLWWRRRLVGVSLSELLDAVVDTIELLPNEAPTAALSALAPLDNGMMSRAHLRGVALRYGLPGDVQGRLFQMAAERRERLVADGVQLPEARMLTTSTGRAGGSTTSPPEPEEAQSGVS